jgi:hypothetical protein
MQDTVAFGNAEAPVIQEAAPEKESNNKTLLIAGGIALAAAGLIFHKRIGKALGFGEEVVKGAGNAVEDVTKGGKKSTETLTKEGETVVSNVAKELKPTEVNDIVKDGKIVGKQKIEYKKEGHKVITETTNDASGNVVAYKRVPQYDSGASAGYTITANKIENGNWEAIIHKGGTKDVYTFSPDKKQCLKWEIQDKEYIYSKELLKKEQWAEQQGYNKLELDRNSELFSSAKSREYMYYSKKYVIGNEYKTTKMEEFIYDNAGKLTNVKFNSGDLVDAQKCMKHTSNFTDIITF